MDGDALGQLFGRCAPPSALMRLAEHQIALQALDLQIHKGIRQSPEISRRRQYFVSLPEGLTDHRGLNFREFGVRLVTGEIRPPVFRPDDFGQHRGADQLVARLAIHDQVLIMGNQVVGLCHRIPIAAVKEKPVHQGPGVAAQEIADGLQGDALGGINIEGVAAVGEADDFGLPAAILLAEAPHFPDRIVMGQMQPAGIAVELVQAGLSRIWPPDRDHRQIFQII